jgi:hypothetical protein
MMNLVQARHDLAQALDEQREPDLKRRLHAARQVLVGQGVEIPGVELPAIPSLHDIIRTAVNAAQSPARRTFAILLVHALAVDGLIAAGSSRSQFDRDLCAFVENALPTVLQRFGYPFTSDTYEKRRSLARLHTVIDELLKPLEPTFPPAVQGLYAG